MQNFSRRKQNRGQVLIIASLIITMLIISTAIYVTETLNQIPTDKIESTTPFSIYKLGITHTVLSSLANISNGGDESVLLTNLNQFKDAITKNSFGTILDVKFTPLNDSSYTNGLRISSNSSEKAISSICVSFALNSTSPSSRSYFEHAINVSTEIELNGSYIQLNETNKQVNLTCKVLNEGNPAKAQLFNISYSTDESNQNREWTPVENSETVDHGNGTYTLTFIIDNSSQNSLFVSIFCLDTRGILVKAIVECPQT